ncbi:hypothetical protein N0V85_003749 [Neurospora sp. IMI 360204]|nr:hypothetical protein N0V85_003749 [Neurospora sp. IMI 360204]
MNRTDHVLAKFTSLQEIMELCKWNETDQEVTLLGELKEQDKQLDTLVSKVAVAAQSDDQIQAKLDELIGYIDQGTTTESMPTEDRDTFVDNVKAPQRWDALKKTAEDVDRRGIFIENVSSGSLESG